jgi:tetratricopeptide (TPR) repeat protein
MAENPRVEELRRRVELDPASIAFAALAEEYRRMGRHEEAIEACRQGLQRHPAYLSARVTLGRALIEVGDFDGARAELETVLKSAPENLAAIRGLAQIHDRLGHSTEMHPDLAALAASPLPVRLAPPPPPEPEPEAEPEVPIHAQPPPVAEPSPFIADSGVNGVAIEYDLDIDLPAESTGVHAIDLDAPSGDAPQEMTSLDTASVDAARIQSADEFEPDPRLARLERFLTAVQHARAGAPQTSALR